MNSSSFISSTIVLVSPAFWPLLQSEIRQQVQQQQQMSALQSRHRGRPGRGGATDTERSIEAKAVSSADAAVACACYFTDFFVAQHFNPTHFHFSKCSVDHFQLSNLKLFKILGRKQKTKVSNTLFLLCVCVCVCGLTYLP